jgi:hypothetical protein
MALLSTDNPEFQAQQRARALGIIEGSERRRKKSKWPTRGTELLIVALTAVCAYLSGVLVTIAGASTPASIGHTHDLDVDVEISGPPTSSTIPAGCHP